MDSLKSELDKCSQDTNRLKVLNKLIDAISDEDVWPKYNDQLGALAFKLQKSKDPQTLRIAKTMYSTYLNNLGFIWVGKGNSTIAIPYFIESLEIDKELGNIYGQAYSENNIGMVYLDEGKIDSALTYFQRSLKKYRKIKNKKGEALSLNNIGYILSKQGKIEKALACYHQSLKLREELNDIQEEGFNLVNIAGLYADQKEYNKAQLSYDKALKIFEKTNSKFGMAKTLNALAACYREQNLIDKALRTFKKAAYYYNLLEDKDGLANSYASIGDCIAKNHQYDSAIVYLNKSIVIYEDLKSKIGLCSAHNSLAQVYLAKGFIDKAKKSAETSYKLSTELKFPSEIANSAKTLSNIFKAQGNCNDSYRMFITYIEMRDSIRNNSTEKAIIRQQEKYEFEQKSILAKVKHEKISALQREETKKQRIIIGFVIIGLLVVITFSVFLYRRFKITQRQKAIIEKQKAEVERQREISENQRLHIQEINKEMVDSITYAKRLQDATLPPIDHITQHLPETFILYKPKDIVAGDFYWFEKTDRYLYLAAADCTGHGVPGAMVSVVCSNALYRAVNEFEIENTGEILDKVRDLVVATFDKGEHDVKDGMDISLIRIPVNYKTSETFDVQWSGAHNPLWLINENGFSEIKADKQPIGKCDNPSPFTSHQIKVLSSTNFYLFTDGYADQFGGPKGKKFRYKQLEDLLIANHQSSTSNQKETLKKSIENWMNNYSQVDDICVIGVKC